MLKGAWLDLFRFCQKQGLSAMKNNCTKRSQEDMRSTDGKSRKTKSRTSSYPVSETYSWPGLFCLPKVFNVDHFSCVVN